uniref:Uncharacterized protein n=1 Tax=Myoviridae sp. ctUPB15 TaxID=2825116 RepID=A0A8S5PVM6_9CAUD|nr:MAG TPA: hypothetical protein [Myoviridae sp. ctUPB15]
MYIFVDKLVDADKPYKYGVSSYLSTVHIKYIRNKK